MKQPLRSAALACLAATFGLLSACGGGGEGCSSVLLGSVAGSTCGSSGSASNTPVSAPTPNRVPVARTSASFSVVTGTLVTLNGSESSDADGQALTYEWSLISRPASSAASLQSPLTPRPTFTADANGTYVVSLRVHDGKSWSEPAYATVNAGAANLAPEALIGPSLINVAVGTLATLDGTGSRDANRDALKYRWEFVSKPAASKAEDTLTKESALARFRADLTGVYVLSLVVNDGQLDSKPQYVTVIASETNTAPTAVISATAQVQPMATVTLDGSASTDPNRDFLTYSWTLVSRPTDSIAFLSSRTVPKPSFQADKPGLYVVSLQVYDGKLYSESTVVAISAETANRAPTARITAASGVKTGTTVTLSGIDSLDPDNDLLEFRWSLLTSPGSVRPTISGDKSPIAQFQAALPGIYVVRLAVFDGKVESTPVYVNVTASSENLKPEANPGVYPVTRPGQTLRLVGGASSDPDKNVPLKYEWQLVSQPAGSTARLQGPLTESPILTPDAVGAWVVGLVVTDSLGLRSDEVTTVISVDTGTVPPVAVAKILGGQDAVPVNTAVKLSGKDSTFSGEALQYEWSVVYMPAGSAVRDDLEKIKNVAEPIVVLDKIGTYVLALVVRGGGATSEKVVLAVKAV